MIAIYITTEELQNYLTLKDEALNEEYQKLRTANKAFYIREYEVTIRTPFNWKHPFRKRKETVTQYEVLEDLGGQARICSFPTAKGAEWSFRTMIGELDLRTFIYGFLNGVSVTLQKLEEYHQPKFSVGDTVKVVDADTLDKARKENNWAISYGADKYCGHQFTICDIKYSYLQGAYTYSIKSPELGFAWFREELLMHLKEAAK